MIRPYRNPRPHAEVALLVTQEYALHETRGLEHVRRLLDERVHVWGAASLLHELTRAGHGSAVLWRSTAIGWHPDRDAQSWPVRAIQLETPDDELETLAGLMQWREWLENFGAAPAGSLGGSGMSLLKATLERDLWTARGAVPPIRFTLGGRQETPGPTPRHEVGDLRHCDIMAAYAASLSRIRYGGTWQHEQGSRRFEGQDLDTLVYARAVVDIPEMPFGFGPLPVRPRVQKVGAAALFWQLRENVYPDDRRLQGTWSVPELENAERCGCRIVRVLDVWWHAAEWRPFTPWYAAVWAGRELGGFAGRLAKATGNATWGQFSIAKGRKKIVARGRDQLVPLRGGNPSQRAFDLAEWIAGSVRAELHRGMYAVAGDLVCAHTDGLWTRGREVGGWRVKHERDSDELRLIDAQHLAYRREGHPWCYVVAGQLDPDEWFEAKWSECVDNGRVAANG